jgi:hypothetical protein
MLEKRVCCKYMGEKDLAGAAPERPRRMNARPAGWWRELFYTLCKPLPLYFRRFSYFHHISHHLVVGLYRAVQRRDLRERSGMMKKKKIR